ncbi:MAG: alanine racemase [Candidatus Zipacnadales bacterium]
MAALSPITYVRVDLAALRHNVAQVRRALREGTRWCPVVKANAYGHGLIRTAQLFVDLGADMLGVTRVEEGMALREAGLTLPILVFHPPTENEVVTAAESGLTLTITDLEGARMLRQLEAQHGSRIDYQIEVDVGLGRSGYGGDPAEFVRTVQEVMGYLPGGIWAHLGPGMVPKILPDQAPPAWAQARSVAAKLRYLETIREEMSNAREREIQPPRMPIFHCAASAVLCDNPQLQWDMVRVGTLLYGAYPAHAHRRPFELRPTLELRTRIVNLRVVSAGTSIGYGGDFRTTRETRLATLPVGLHHGVGLIPESAVSIGTGIRRWLARTLGVHGRTFRPTLVRIGPHWAPLIGRVSLNECTVDVTPLPSVSIGTEVAVPVRMTTLNPNIPRRYIEDK